MMSAPSRASVMAWLRPWPRAAPVMQATLPSTRPVIVLSSLSSNVCCIQHEVVVLAGVRTKLAGPGRARHRLCLVFASVGPDWVSRRRPIRMICAGAGRALPALHNHGLTVVAREHRCHIRLECPVPDWRAVDCGAARV
jgi:hypothetical protein